MLQSFAVKNFRCFREFTLNPLSRLNLITGKNNVGKTALLEGLLLHLSANHPEISLTVNPLRGMEQSAANAVEIWGWLFHGKDIDRTIELASQGHDGRTRTLRIYLCEPTGSRMVTTTTPAPFSSSGPGPYDAQAISRELMLEYQDDIGQMACTQAYLTGEGIRVEGQRVAPFCPRALLSTHVRLPQEDAERFSKIEEVGRQDEVVAAAKLLEPRLSRLAVSITSGVPMINGDIGLGRLVPVPLMGEGLVRVLSMVLAIANTRGGIVLIDEVENGVHYSVLKQLWQALAKAARRAEVQVFATTHSQECIRAAHEAFVEAGTYDFRLHRLEQRDTGEIESISYDQETLDTSLGLVWEVR